ncbi:hypothetical protein LMANV2_480048 [Leptospira interrogans serovar Manilae]|uniref:Uncharacterized protein n=1 Tax=Leptospira interrogans serovar Manilae TaxID=214675 RepID=A0AAQ1P0A4_LEPIR|nr:hypothetical protein LMANV2_480048 [Leptospira interrogans serovar Manilae]
MFETSEKKLEFFRLISIPYSAYEKKNSKFNPIPFCYFFSLVPNELNRTKKPN